MKMRKKPCREIYVRSIQERFQEFHDEHPEVYAHLVRLARTAHDKARTKLGIKMLYEVERVARGRFK